MSGEFPLFNFPETRFAAENTSDDQIDHVLSEAFEVMEASSYEHREEEMADLTHSLETYWRRKVAENGAEYVRGIFARVVNKNDVRGYYAKHMESMF